MLSPFAPKTPLALALAAVLPVIAHAADNNDQTPTASAVELAPTSVTASSERLPKRVLDPNLPSSSATVTADQLQYQNVETTEDALRYVPGMAVRRRFIGDLNSTIAVRGTSNSQTARGLVYADGLLLSNFLGNTWTFAPRWSMVFPEEIDQVDVIYGPFSALYPGNSIGATVLVSTRMPDKFVTDAKIQGFTQHFNLFGVNQSFNGSNVSASVGDKFGNLSLLVGVDHMENTGQPLQFYTATQSTTPATASAKVVSGAYSYRDQNGVPGVVMGVNGEGIERVTQDQLKLKATYDFTPTLQGGFSFGYWHQNYNSQTSTFLRDANGNPVYSGTVNINGYQYVIPASAFAPSQGVSENLLYGLSLKTRHKSGWNWEAIASYFDISQSEARTASTGAPGDGPGTVTYGDGTGGKSIDLRSTYTPAQVGAGAHWLAFGYHFDTYFLDNRTFNTSAWVNGNDTSLANAFGGNTLTQALYAQDTWQFLPRWKLTTGLRYEDWRAYSGARTLGGLTVPYAGSSDSHFSPKLSLAFAATQDLTLRASIARAYRFPTVSELFQGSITGTNIVNNNPGLRPEDDLAKELSAEWQLEVGKVRVSLFQDDVKNTIFSQTNTTVFPNVTNFQNIDKVRSRGIDTAFDGQDVLFQGLDIAAGLTYTQSKIMANTNNPASVGKYFYRIPLWRANLVATYRFNAKSAVTGAIRYSGRQYNTLTNTDNNPNTFGGTSTYTVVDAKFTYKPTARTQIGIGVDNLFDTRYFVYHPYAGRTFFIEGKFAI
ncbi:TonB-dependent receptor [Pandoraea sp. XJJ-1]|uniref:TonB-dependent receptor n=1 Tax=Pandoraea sp. XJJ-1 TaxID=3002643 RepID=UPI00227F8878|nr:TonB-dependent receptor [Pandoraea sp. XJJ-1]WAL84054.1 TonB-dependent receptor [Pandoraea sp. XJJ-1]